MISINTEQVKELCSKILFAVDTSGLSAITETLELKAENGVLYFNVTNDSDYFVSAKIPTASNVDFKATVKADLFLKLVANTTTEVITLDIEERSLIFKGNGNYKLPLIYEGADLLVLPRIDINNQTANFMINEGILESIALYNNKELAKGVITNNAIQSLFYLDEKGCITFTSGACVNNFTLPQPVKLLLTSKIVKLFKLFKKSAVNFTLGYDAYNGSSTIQTKVKFENDKIALTAILPSEAKLFAGFPADGIRNLLTNPLPYSVTFDRDAMVQALTRLLLFHPEKKLKAYGKLDFDQTGVTIKLDSTTVETVPYMGAGISQNYSAYINLGDLKTTFEACSDTAVPLSFGDGQAFIITKDNVNNVLAETHESIGG